jgi:putative transposase
MPRRLVALETGDIYHIMNRGVEKRKIFLSKSDFEHFLEGMDHYRSSESKLSRKLGSKHNLNKELVEILAYCLMPNHFHLLLKQKRDGGISQFMGRLANSFTKYFNLRHDRVGPLFQGEFKAVSVDNDEQLLHLSRYIHLNPVVSGLLKDMTRYEWSSYPVYIEQKENGFLSTKEILAYFSKRKNTYKDFVADQARYLKSLDKIQKKLLE